MKVVFVYNECENLGIEYLSAVLKKHGHETELVFDPMLFSGGSLNNGFLAKFFSLTNEVVEDVINLKPGLVVFNVLTDYYSWACDIAKRIKEKSDIPIIFGGIHTTSVPEIVIRNDFVDFICVGEGEYALLDLVNSLEREEINCGIKNIWFKKMGKIIKNDIRPLADINKLPFPDKELFIPHLSKHHIKEYTTLTQRGCPNRCTYCCNSFYASLYRKYKFLRRRSIPNIIKELKIAKRRYGIKSVIFHDETFFTGLGWLRDFCKIYKKEIDLPFFVWLHPNTVNEEVVHLLKNAGCRTAVMGVQTLNKEIMKKILHRYTSNEKIRKAISLLEEAKIFVITDNMLGLPGQKKKDIIDLVLFYLDNYVDLPRFFWLRYYPMTEIINIAKSNKTLNGKNLMLNKGNTNLFTIGGDSYNVTYSKIRNLLFFRQFLPKKIIKFIIKKRLYIYLPEMKYLSFFINNIFALFFGAILKGKKYLDYSGGRLSYLQKNVYMVKIMLRKYFLRFLFNLKEYIYKKHRLICYNNR